MPKNFFALIIVSIILISALVLRITDNSGEWLCLEGEWIRKGRTNKEKPQEACIDYQKIHDYNICSELNDFKWCQEIEKCIASTLSCLSFVDQGLVEEKVVIIQPLPNELIHSPYEIRGMASGTWFFEADFEIRLVDLENNVLAKTIAIAQDDWMTTDLVPFLAELQFETDYQGPASLLFIKDNPTGLEYFDNFYELNISI